MKKLHVREDKSRRPLQAAQARFATFAKLKPSSTAISLRLPDSVLARLKVKAHRQGIPYQSYIKAVLAEAASGEG